MRTVLVNQLSIEPIDGMPTFAATSDGLNPGEEYVLVQTSEDGLYLEVGDQLHARYGPLKLVKTDESIELHWEGAIPSLGISALSLTPGVVSYNEIESGLEHVLSLGPV